MNLNIHLGARVECENIRGTVKWVGQVPGIEGEWIGVDWDDPNRGKHNGSYKGMKFFSTRQEKSGSFVRPYKVIFGQSLEDAVRGKYQDDHKIEEIHTACLKRNINASFVEVVGMEKIGKKQSALENLEIIVLDGLPVKDGGMSDLKAMLPRLRDLDISNSLISNWNELASITQQLPNLRMLNISGNLLASPENPRALVDSLSHITYLVMNRMLHYTWKDLIFCIQAFPKLEKIQLAFNNLSSLGPVPPDIFQHLEELDLGGNHLNDWTDICHLGKLPKLREMNLNDCNLSSIQFLDTPPGSRTDLFQSLKSLILAKNPLVLWDAVGELDKLPVLNDLIVSNDAVEGRGNFFVEYTFGRIRNLTTLNRTTVNLREKRDFQLFYLRSFSSEYYESGGRENPEDAVLTTDFVEKHPTYLHIVKICGAPLDERSHESEKTRKLRDLKIELLLVPPQFDESVKHIIKSFLPSTRISRMKMMIKRLLHLSNSTKIRLFHCNNKSDSKFEIELDDDMKELQFYSVEDGDIIKICW